MDEVHKKSSQYTKTHAFQLETCEALVDIIVAVRTGLEPATSCVTGRHSNQLNYRTTVKFTKKIIGCGGRIRTCDLWVMSPTSYRTAPPRDIRKY